MVFVLCSQNDRKPEILNEASIQPVHIRPNKFSIFTVIAISKGRSNLRHFSTMYVIAVSVTSNNPKLH